MSNQLLLSMVAEDGGGQALVGTPLDYGSSLRFFLDAENDAVTSGSDVTSWTDQDTGIVFDTPAGARNPVFDAATQNGLPGVNFQQPVGETFLNRKITAAASVVDNFFSGSGDKTLAFAARLNRLTDTSFDTFNSLAEKGFRQGTGWRFSVSPNGTVAFEHHRANGSIWSIRSNGFYSVGDLVLGSVTYDGGNTSGSGTMRLYNQSDFIDVGVVTNGTSSSIASDGAEDMIIGNTRDPNNAQTNTPFEGPIFGIWMTNPGSTIFDDSYMSRWIP